MTKTKLRNRHGSAESLWDWQPNSIISPVQNNQKWAVYNNFEVDIAANTKLLEMNYGVDWMIPDVQQWQLECPNVDDQTVEQWIDDIQSKMMVITQPDPSFQVRGPVLVHDPCLLPSMTFFLLLLVVAYGVVVVVYRKYRRSLRSAPGLLTRTGPNSNQPRRDIWTLEN